MPDKITKILLTVVAVLLLALMIRLPITTVQAQAPSQALPTMAVDKGTIYILQNNTLSIYEADPGIKVDEAFAMLDPQKRLAMLKRMRVYHLVTQDLSKAESPKDTPTTNTVATPELKKAQ